MAQLGGIVCRGREGLAAGAWASIGSTKGSRRVDICVQFTFSFFFNPGPQPTGVYTDYIWGGPFHLNLVTSSQTYAGVCFRGDSKYQQVANGN